MAAADLILIVGRALALATAFSAIAAVIRRRDSQRVDILLAVLTVALPVLWWPGPLRWVGVALYAARPYLLLRLVSHFRQPPRWLIFTAVALVPVELSLQALWPGPRLGYIDLSTGVVIAAVLAYAAAAFVFERRTAAGVTAKRLGIAAFGTGVLAARESLVAWAVVFPGMNEPLGSMVSLVNGVLLICFFFAFSPPRALVARWQREEQARYLAATAERDVEVRGQHTAADLNRAAAAAVSNAATLVALRDSPAAGQPLVVRAASIPALVDLPLAERGLVGRVLETRAPESGPLAECDPALAARLRGHGARVLAAPIASAEQLWGVVIAVQRRGSLFPDDDLRLLAHLGRYAGMALDHAQLVAERHARERRAADRRLREVESRMSLMLDSIKDYALFVIDHHGRIVSWEPGAEQVFGHPAAEMRDQPIAPLLTLEEPALLATLDRARTTGSARLEGICRRRNGTAFTGETVIRRLSGEDDLDGFVAVTHDVTDQRHLEERLRQSAKLEAVGLLAAGVAHDFNNILTAIVGYAGLLQNSLPDSDPRADDCEEIMQAAERAAWLTQQLLAFSRRQELQTAVIDLSYLVSDLLPLLRSVAGPKVRLTHEGDQVWPVTADPSQLDRVLLNLVSNAHEAMPDGGRLTIRTTNVVLDEAAAAGEVEPGSFVLLEVTDTGVGMNEQTRARLFEPFFTTKTVGRGVGLGLSAVYGVMRLMQGTIRVESAPGQGATFRLYFPADVRHAKAAAVATAVAQPVVRLPRQGALLLVEHDPVMRAQFRQALEQGGFRVIAAEHQSAALQLAAASTDPITLLISDAQSAGGSGASLVDALSQVQPGIPALLLPTPCSTTDLLARVRQILTPTA